MPLETVHHQKKNILKKEIPLYVVLLLFAGIILLLYFFFPKPPAVVRYKTVQTCSPTINEIRLKDFRFTHPLMFADIPEENEQLQYLKEKVDGIISSNKASNAASDVSVYFCKLYDGEWFAINSSLKYVPSSMLKVSLLITILKQADSNPHLLDKEIYVKGREREDYSQTVKDFQLEEKRSYSVRQLLEYMIKYSDNDAAMLLGQMADKRTYAKLFTDLQIDPPNTDEINLDKQYSMSIMDCCKLFKILYNSGYISDANSDFALELLSESTFKNGLLKNLAAAFPVAHKFGEREMSNIQQLHEIGIFYFGSKPYLLGIMSSGHDMNQLSNVLGQISETVFRHMSNPG